MYHNDNHHNRVETFQVHWFLADMLMVQLRPRNFVSYCILLSIRKNLCKVHFCSLKKHTLTFCLCELDLQLSVPVIVSGR
jgi:hypothetical protein